MKVALVPEQIVVLGVAIVTLGVTAEFTLIVTLLLVAVAVVWQVLFAVSTQLTICPLVKVLEEYVALLEPTLVPFTFHW